MKSIAYLPASNQSANASLMTVTNIRAALANTIKVNTVANAPVKFAGTMGTPHTFTDPVTSETITIISEASAVDFFGSISGSDVIIDQIAAGYTDLGSKVGDIIVIKPITEDKNNLYNILNQSHNDDGTIKDAAVTYNPNAKDHFPSGGVWAALTGLNAGMSALTVYQAGYRGTIAAVATRAFTLSKDTYVDVLRTMSGYTPSFSLVYTEVANGAAAPALAANSVRLAKVVTNATTVTGVTQSTAAQAWYDSLGNPIQPLAPGDTTNKVWIPDYANKEATDRWASSATWTSDRRGFVYMYMYGYVTGAGNWTNTFTINGQTVLSQTTEQAGSNGAKPGTNAIVLPVNVGDVIAYSQNGNINGKACNFIPGRWV